jgi:UDP-N-acetylglucosamine 2-epimerase
MPKKPIKKPFDDRLKAAQNYLDQLDEEEVQTVVMGDPMLDFQDTLDLNTESKDDRIRRIKREYRQLTAQPKEEVETEPEKETFWDKVEQVLAEDKQFPRINR